MEKLYPCSFKCLTCVTVVACMRVSPLLFFFFFFFTSATSVLSSLFSFSGSFSSILLTMFFSQHHIFNAFSPKHVLFTVFGFWNIFKMFCCLACKIKSLFAENRGNFLTEFCCSNSSNLIGSRWFLLSFSANQRPFEICTRVTGELLSFLSQSEMSNFFVYRVFQKFVPIFSSLKFY